MPPNAVPNRIPISIGIRQGCSLSCTLFNLYTSYLATILNRIRPTVTPAAPRVNALFYADDIMLIANSHHDMQLLLGRLRHHCADLQMQIDFDKTQIIALHEVTEEKQKTFGMGGKQKPLSEKAMYLGVPFSAKCDPLLIYQHRMQITKKKLAGTAHAIKTMGIRHLKHLKILLNAYIIQPMLYACEVWGPALLSSTSLHIVTNDMQKLVKEFFTKIYNIPPGTPHLTVLLELGLEPVLLTIAVRVNKFLSKLSLHKQQILSNSTVEAHTLPHDRSIVHVWMRFLTDQLKLADTTIDTLPDTQQLTSIVQNNYLSPIIAQHASDDLKSDQCKHRIISSYIQLLWHQKLGCHHPIYDTHGLPYDVYMDVLRLRTLNVPAHVYTLPRVKRNIPYSRRLCPFGCHTPADLEHVIEQCPRTKLPSSLGHSLHTIFGNHEPEHLFQLAHSIHSLMHSLRTAGDPKQQADNITPAEHHFAFHDDDNFAQLHQADDDLQP